MRFATIFNSLGKPQFSTEADTFEALLANLATLEQLTHISYNNDQGDLIKLVQSEVEGHPLDHTTPTDILDHPSGALRDPRYIGKIAAGKWVVCPVDRTQGWGFAIIDEA